MNLQQLIEHETQEALNNISVNWESGYERIIITEGKSVGVKFSHTSKLPRAIPSWDLEAGATCPGSICPETGVRDSCQGCYAQTGHYMTPESIALRKHNRVDWKRPDWESDMIGMLEDLRRFRWFSSGDVYTAKLAEKIYNVIKATPHISHWFPTMSHNVPKLAKIIDKIDKLPNVALRRSAGNIDGTFVDTDGSTVVDRKTAEKWVKNGVPKGIFLCPAGTSEDGEVPRNSNKKKGITPIKGKGECRTCRTCFDKETKMIAYIKH